MSEKKIIYDQYLSNQIHNPAYEFVYEDGKYLVMINIIEKSYTVKRTDRNMLLSKDVDLIREWIKKNNIDGQWHEWKNIIIPIIRFFEIPKKERKMLSEKFIKTTKIKLERSIKKVKRLIKISDLKWENLIPERQFLDARLNGYTYFLNTLKNKRSGHNKLLPEIIKPLFDKLSELSYSGIQQNEIVSSLFRLGKFDSFQDYYPIDEDTALNKINKIRNSVLTP